MGTIGLQWRRYEDVAAALTGPVDEDWATDRRLLDDELANPDEDAHRPTGCG